MNSKSDGAEHSAATDCYAVSDVPPPKDGTRILLYFTCHGWVTAEWDDPHDTDSYIWCVDDFKHGPYPVRGYVDDEVTHWMPLPESPVAA